jgi:choline kinase
MNGLIAAAGLSSRLQDLADRRNKVLLDLGGATLLGTLLSRFEQCGITDTVVVAGFDGPGVRLACGTRAQCVLNPFFEHYGILGSFWVVRHLFEGRPFVFSVGDHYVSLPRFQAFLTDQAEADILVDVELKTCDDEDMKVFLNRQGKLRTMTKACLDGPVLGEFTGAVRFSADGSSQFFTMLERHVWGHGIQGYLADVLCVVHRKWDLAFHLSADHDRVEVDFPCDVLRARELYARELAATRMTG